MNAKSSQLAERRDGLIAQAAAQRAALANQIEPWRQPLARIDLGLAVLRHIRRHPFWLAGGLALLVVFRPVRVGILLKRSWDIWRVVQGLRIRR